MEVILPQPVQMVTSNVPAFLAKLWKMVDDPETNHLIEWGDEGNSFVIHNHGEFEQTLLPYYYKHSNMASFVRQLNMYGFHKKVGIDSGGLKSEHVEEQEFYHPYFLRGQEHLLENIKRKIASSKAPAGVPVPNLVPASINSEKINSVVTEVNKIKENQEDMDGKLDTMKKENEALWREVVSLRQKHLSQQKIVNKLIQFLVSLVSQPRGRMPGGLTASGNNALKRSNLSLAFEGAAPSKERKISGSSDIHQIPKYDQRSGPTIQEVLPEESVDFMTTETQPKSVVPPMSPFSEAVAAAVGTAINPYLVDNSTPTQNSATTLTLHSGTDSNNMQHTNFQQSSPSGSSSSGPKRPTLHRELSREDMDLEVNTVQKDLDHLKDMLSGQITLDSSLISNLFNPDESLSALFGTQDLNLGPFSPPTVSQSSSSGVLQPLEMEMPTSRDAALLAISSASAAQEPEAQAYIQNSNELDDQPPLFEFADIDDMDEQIDVVSPTPANTGEKQKNTRTIRMPMITNDDLSLNTPLISSGDDQDNPLLKSIINRKKK